MQDLRDRISHAARYGRQSRNEILGWPMRDLVEFNTDISAIIKAEGGGK